MCMFRCRIMSSCCACLTVIQILMSYTGRYFKTHIKAKYYQNLFRYRNPFWSTGILMSPRYNVDMELESQCRIDAEFTLLTDHLIRYRYRNPLSTVGRLMSPTYLVDLEFWQMSKFDAESWLQSCNILGFGTKSPSRQAAGWCHCSQLNSKI